MNANNPIRIVVPGPPQAQKRHRHAKRGAFVRVYDPSQSDKADFLAICLASRPETPLEGPLGLELWFDFPRPKSHYGSKGLKPASPAYHTSKPDSDNLAKFVIDSLNGIFWKDDSQISKLSVVKWYGCSPKTQITITKLA